MKNLPQRKPNRLRNYNYSQNGAYFITICTTNRTEILSKIHSIPPPVGADTIRPNVELSPIGKIANEAMQNISNIYADDAYIDNYIIMPNHIHLILIIETQNTQNENHGGSGRIISVPTPPPKTVSTIIGSFKRFVSKQCGKQIWQKSFHDHIIRNEQEYNRISKYIEDNPIKWHEDILKL